jgi:hypothetical protein
MLPGATDVALERFSRSFQTSPFIYPPGVGGRRLCAQGNFVGRCFPINDPRLFSGYGGGMLQRLHAGFRGVHSAICPAGGNRLAIPLQLQPRPLWAGCGLLTPAVLYLQDWLGQVRIRSNSLVFFSLCANSSSRLAA